MVVRKLSYITSQVKKGSAILIKVTFLAMLIGACLVSPPLFASNHYTDKQLAALATRVGKMFWVVPAQGRIPLFLSAPDARARTFRPQENESFEITDLVGQKAKNPYYKTKFESGKEGYVSIEAFLEELNSTIVSIDPLADEKKRAAEQELEEKQRLEWIQKQPWSQSVKDAAIKRQAVMGMTRVEVRRVLGQPTRTARVNRPQRSSEVQWFYQDGSVLVFHNGMLSRIERKSAQE
jgi:hypothetical protein